MVVVGGFVISHLGFGFRGEKMKSDMSMHCAGVLRVFRFFRVRFSWNRSWVECYCIDGTSFQDFLLRELLLALNEQHLPSASALCMFRWHRCISQMLLMQTLKEMLRLWTQTTR